MADNADLAVQASTATPCAQTCPAWCAGETGSGKHDVHESVAVEWEGPGSHHPHDAALSASIALFCEGDEGDDERQPEIWFGSSGTWTELDLPQLETVIREVEDYSVALHSLRYRYAAALAGEDLSSKNRSGSTPPKHPVEITALCPPWCEQDDQDHNARWLVDRHHGGMPREVVLTHEPVETDDVGVWSARIELSLAQPAYSRMPEIQLTAEGRSSTCVSVSLSEAKQLRTTLGELIAAGEECATPDTLPLLDEVVTRMGAKIIEDSRLDSKSEGYALGNAGPGGHVWVCIPKGLPNERRERAIRGLLAGLYSGPARAMHGSDASLLVTGDRQALAKTSKLVAA